MPQLFKIGAYLVFFWTNENDPLEPVHVHVTTGKPSPGATKIWISSSGRCLLAHNRSHIPEKDLRFILRLLEAEHETILAQWLRTFGSIRYYC